MSVYRRPLSKPAFIGNESGYMIETNELPCGEGVACCLHKHYIYERSY